MRESRKGKSDPPSFVMELLSLEELKRSIPITLLNRNTGTPRPAPTFFLCCRPTSDSQAAPQSWQARPALGHCLIGSGKSQTLQRSKIRTRGGGKVRPYSNNKNKVSIKGFYRP